MCLHIESTQDLCCMAAASRASVHIRTAVGKQEFRKGHRIDLYEIYLAHGKEEGLVRAIPSREPAQTI